MSGARTGGPPARNRQWRHDGHAMPPIDLKVVLLTALLNPAVPVVAFWLGRRADQWQKVPVAAFAAALAGSLLIYVGVRLGVPSVAGVGRAAAGVFTAQLLFGLAWAAAGYRLRGPVTLIRVLHLWLAASAVLLTAGAIWALAPVLVFVVLLVAALGLVSLTMIALARALRRWRERHPT
jgi:hypothetical protein